MFNPLPSDSYLWAEFRSDFVEQNFVFFTEASSSSVLVGVVNNSSPTPSINLMIKERESKVNIYMYIKCTCVSCNFK